MKKQDRELYIELTREIGGNLCVFCKHAEWESSGCDEGYAVCVHPIESLSTQNVREEDLTPGDDCYGFTPNMPVFLIADIVGAIISQGWDTWFFRRYSKTSVTIYGERYRAEFIDCQRTEGRSYGGTEYEKGGSKRLWRSDPLESLRMGIS